MFEKRFGVHDPRQKVMIKNSALHLEITWILVHQTHLTLLFSIVRSVEQLASIDLNIDIYYKDMFKYLRIPTVSFVSQWDTMKMNVAALTSWEREPMMLIGYKTSHKAMMDMVTTVVEVFSEVIFMVVCLEEVEARLFAITIIRQDM